MMRDYTKSHEEKEHGSSIIRHRTTLTHHCFYFLENDDSSCASSLGILV